ncbi:MAG TPA: hypothetical protein PLN89_07995 [Elusimicrobiota bacterium]|nr:hypothetical protein [Elusimicrobiota bacterium]
MTITQRHRPQTDDVPVPGAVNLLFHSDSAHQVNMGEKESGELLKVYFQ